MVAPSFPFRLRTLSIHVENRSPPDSFYEALFHASSTSLHTLSLRHPDVPRDYVPSLAKVFPLVAPRLLHLHLDLRPHPASLRPILSTFTSLVSLTFTLPHTDNSVPLRRLGPSLPPSLKHLSFPERGDVSNPWTDQQEMIVSHNAPFLSISALLAATPHLVALTRIDLPDSKAATAQAGPLGRKLIGECEERGILLVCGGVPCQGFWLYGVGGR